MARAACDRRTEHPLMVAAARGDLAPSTCRRAVGAAAWQRHPVRDFLRDLHGWDQMAAVALRGDGTEICGLAFARTGRDFTDEQLALLAAVQPLLQAVERHAARLAAWQVRLDDAAPGRARDAGLTTREVEVLMLMSQCCTASATARPLGCSPRTVEKHPATCTGSWA